ncbi:MAG: hypothetical protein DRI56_05290 [Chloroflexota bacterium]|nr:MAG: hypothetical protein DRI56_05290 [Chloroflexota bacterium]
MNSLALDKLSRNIRLGIYWVLFILVLMGIGLSSSLVQASDNNQQPTGSLPTVTGTPTGPIAIVWSDPEDQINVRSGPGVNYPQVGVLINREVVPAIGKSAGGSWIQIVYLGAPEGVAWVYAPLVRVTGELPIVAPPPTPTPLTTPTIDPTLAAQFVVNIPPTRKPTYTPPPVLVIPTYPVQDDSTGAGGLPMGFLIVGLAVFGVLGLVVSFLREL